MQASALIASTVVLAYVAFVLWYGGRGKPMDAAEVERFMQQLSGLTSTAHQQELLGEVRTLVAKDDGREFVMQNLVRYRARALYPAGSPFGDDPREADKRYGRAIVPHLLRYGNVPVFIARRSGSFIQPAGSQEWHYVAMVRYRSKRDFLRFALRIESANIAMHKWAAIETTQVFPVQPMVSLIFVRAAVAAVMIGLGCLINALVC